MTGPISAYGSPRRAGARAQILDERWQDFKRWVLIPALNGINDYGTVKVKVTPQKTGRFVTAIRFDWQWKSLDEARETEEENQQPKGARHMDRKRDDAPPL